MRNALIFITLFLMMTGKALGLPAVALITADQDNPNLTDIQNKLAATGRFAAVEGYNFYEQAPGSRGFVAVRCHIDLE